MPILRTFLISLVILWGSKSLLGQEKVKLVPQISQRSQGLQKSWLTSNPWANHGSDEIKTSALSLDGKTLATSSESQTIIWDVSSRLQKRRIPRLLPFIKKWDAHLFILRKEVYTNLALIPNSPYLVGVWNFSGRTYGNNGENFRETRLVVWNWETEELIRNSVLKEREFHLEVSKDGDRMLLVTFASHSSTMRLETWSIPEWEPISERRITEDDNPFNFHHYLNAYDKFNDLRFRWFPSSDKVAIGRRLNLKAGSLVNPNFSIDIWNTADLKVEQSLRLIDKYLSYPLIDFGISPDGKYLLGIYISNQILNQSSEDYAEKDRNYFIARWDLETGQLLKKGNKDIFFERIPFGKEQNFSVNDIRYVSREGKYFYSNSEGVIDLMTAEPVTDLPKLGSWDEYGHLGDYNIDGIPLPDVPTSLILPNSYQNDRGSSVAIFDLTTRRVAHLANPERFFQKIKQIDFGKDGLLKWSYSEYDPEVRSKRSWWDFSSLDGYAYALEKEQIHDGKAMESNIYTVEGMNRGWIQVELRNPNFSYCLDIDQKRISGLIAGVRRPLDLEWISPGGNWILNSSKDLLKLNETNKKYEEVAKIASDLKGKYPVLFSHKEDRVYLHDNKSKNLAWCKLSNYNQINTLNFPICNEMTLSPNDQYLVLRYPDRFDIIDTKTMELLHTLKKGFCSDACFSKDGKQLLISVENRVEVYDVSSFEKVDSLITSLEGISGIDISPEGDRLAIAGTQQIEIRELSNYKLIATFVDLPNGHHFIFTPDNYYTVSKGAEDNIAFQQGKNMYSFESFDLIYHRPDIIMERLGYASTQYIEFLKKVYQKRLEKQGVNTAQSNPKLSFPEVHILNRREIPFESVTPSISLNLKASDSYAPLSRLQISINEVPIIKITAKTDEEIERRTYTKNFDLRLTAPENTIEVQVWNEKGIASIKQKLYVRLAKEVKVEKPDLYLAVIGVSAYKDEQMNLRYAAKDAKDILQAFMDRRGAFKSIHHFELLNEQVTRENILSLREDLQKAKPQDRIVLFMAGHGLLTQNLDFYFGTHDVDFSNPVTRGIAFTELEDILANLVARQKILLMDACHSGELDQGSSEVEIIEQNTEVGKVSFRSFGSTKIKKAGEYANSFSLMKELFLDLRRNSGAIIISAASGEEVAIEGGEYQNGLFTYALLEGMGGVGNHNHIPADKDNNEQITISELKSYVQKRVSDLTDGMQKPTSRVEYLYNDFVLWDLSKADGEGIYSTLDKLQAYIYEGGNVNQRDNNGATFLMKLINYSDDPSLARWLVSQGANPKLKGTIPLNEGGYYGNLTSIAAAKGKLGMLKFLIEECNIPVDDREYDEDDQADTGWTALQWAANKGQLEVVNYLISMGAEINPSFPQSPPIVLAARHGHTEVIQTLLDSGADINQANEHQMNALAFAARYGLKETMQLLIQKGADLNHQEEEGWTPAMLAGINKHYDCLEVLLQAGVNMDLKTKTGETLVDLASKHLLPAIGDIINYKGPNRPFFLAIKQKDQEAVSEFIREGASLSTKDAYGASMLIHILSEFNDWEFIKEVMGKKPDLTFNGVIWSNKVGGGYYGNLQCLAAAKGKMELLKYLVEEQDYVIDEPEYNPNEMAHTGWTALQWAANQKQNDCIIFLLEKGANKDIGIKDGDTPALLYARQEITKGNPEEYSASILLRLLTKENINCKTSEGWTVWHYLTRDGWGSIENPQTMIFSRQGAYRTFLELFERGADVNAKTNRGWTPLMLASLNGHSPILNYLKIGDENGADPNLTNSEGNTALILAAAKGHAKICSYLINQGADCSIKNHEGKTALDLARQNGHDYVVKLLEQCQ